MKRDERTSSTTQGAQPQAKPAREEPSPPPPPPDQHRPASAFPVSSGGRSVELHIEELVLRGFPAVDRHLIGEAFERELTRLFTERGAPHSLTQGGDIIARLNGGAFELRPGSDSETIGAQLARAIYGRLGQ
ncbi:MAG TPA: hypothetical protein VGX92_14010 [Pyrinomonadaceae bacterium]|jgi:hypothetical protein|nr:hypothetical protein [Pyrinomonadaceae bacterium]